LGQIAPWFFSTRHLANGSGLLLPFLAIIRIRQALTPPHPSNPSNSILHSELGPIRSNHWGER
ncbi:MAG TPA: hypothetical protein VH250_03350, partial [Granulicella sp.]|nr:hypothetical protein [Granulicella sp.]